MEIILFWCMELLQMLLCGGGFEALASKFDVIAVTLRHFDEGDIGGFGLNTHADDLIELLNELDERKPVHIVGWSYSADVVLNALVKQDFSVEKVFL